MVSTQTDPDRQLRGPARGARLPWLLSLLVLSVQGCSQSYLIRADVLTRAQRVAPGDTGRLAVSVLPTMGKVRRSFYIAYPRLKPAPELQPPSAEWRIVRGPATTRGLMRGGGAAMGAALGVAALGGLLYLVPQQISVFGGCNDHACGSLEVNTGARSGAAVLFVLGGMGLAAGLSLCIAGAVADPVVETRLPDWRYLPP